MCQGLDDLLRNLGVSAAYRNKRQRKSREEDRQDKVLVHPAPPFGASPEQNRTAHIHRGAYAPVQRNCHFFRQA